MDEILAQIETKMARLLASGHQLSLENQDLKRKLADIQQANERLHARLDEARTRVETALSRMPVESDAP